MPAQARSAFAGPVVARYDSDYRFVVAVDRDIEPLTRAVEMV